MFSNSVNSHDVVLLSQFSCKAVAAVSLSSMLFQGYHMLLYFLDLSLLFVISVTEYIHKHYQMHLYTVSKGNLSEHILTLGLLVELSFTTSKHIPALHPSTIVIPSKVCQTKDPFNPQNKK